MNKKIAPILLLVFFLLQLSSSHAIGQTYSFSVDRETVNVYWNDDGTLSIDYLLVFTNDAWASPIDYVDIGFPNPYYDINEVVASVDNYPISDIQKSPYVDNGVALGLGNQSIKPGATGSVRVSVNRFERVLYPDSSTDDYVSAVFSPNWFGEEYVNGTSDIEIIFHLPPGVLPEEPRWHAAPTGWPEQPITGFDDQGRIIYTWTNPTASASQQYKFGASFPARNIPAEAIVHPSIWETLGISLGQIVGCLFPCSIVIFIILAIVLSIKGAQKRKLQYLPPKIAIEGHGIKRGLTAIEAAVLLEQPLDKILTMILFSVIKKNAASVSQKNPLKLKFEDKQPESLRTYETKFLEAFKNDNKNTRNKLLQETIIDLVQSVSQKMKGFSRKETIEYYQEIVNRAWTQVEDAETPEVKSEKYNDVMEWTMLDRDYDDKTKRVFQGGPVFVPMWWGRYDPDYRPLTASPGQVGKLTPGTPGGSISLPHLPGSDFAASIVNGVQNVSANVVGNLTEFTSNVTSKTNPVPVSSGRSFRSSSGGGGCACACACACAGCACACAGGGR